MQRDQLEQSVLKELNAMLGKEIGSEEDLLYEGGLDSFGIMQLVAYLEDSYGFRIPDEQLVTDNFSSARRIVDWVMPLLG